MSSNYELRFHRGSLRKFKRLVETVRGSMAEIARRGATNRTRSILIAGGISASVRGQSVPLPRASFHRFTGYVRPAVRRGADANRFSPKFVIQLWSWHHRRVEARRGRRVSVSFPAAAPKNLSSAMPNWNRCKRATVANAAPLMYIEAHAPLTQFTGFDWRVRVASTLLPLQGIDQLLSIPRTLKFD